jgi:Zn-dependent protease with chaperone function
MPEWTRNPEALGGALRKLLWQQEKLGLDFAPAHPLVAHMQFQADPGGTDELLQWFEQHFATHPPVHARIERIYGEPMEALPCGESPRPVAVF